jgi:hypothetical protein
MSLLKVYFRYSKLILSSRNFIKVIIIPDMILLVQLQIRIGRSIGAASAKWGSRIIWIVLTVTDIRSPYCPYSTLLTPRRVYKRVSLPSSFDRTCRYLMNLSCSCHIFLLLVLLSADIKNSSSFLSFLIQWFNLNFWTSGGHRRRYWMEIYG